MGLTLTLVTSDCAALQDPEVAVQEADPYFKGIECYGILINGYSNLGTVDTVQYLQQPQCDPSWAKLVRLVKGKGARIVSSSSIAAAGFTDSQLIFSLYTTESVARSVVCSNLAILFAARYDAEEHRTTVDGNKKFVVQFPVLDFLSIVRSPTTFLEGVDRNHRQICFQSAILHHNA